MKTKRLVPGPQPGRARRALREEARANAPLIAAVPELLIALESLVEFVHAALGGTAHDDTLQHYERIARRAIARAKARPGAEDAPQDAP